MARVARGMFARGAENKGCDRSDKAGRMYMFVVLPSVVVCIGK